MGSKSERHCSRRKQSGIILLASFHREESTLPAADFRNLECAFERGYGRLFEEVAALPRLFGFSRVLDPCCSAENSSGSKITNRFLQPRRYADGMERTWI
jgi:hypothetical protein